jgi:hypothetical protein
MCMCLGRGMGWSRVIRAGEQGQGRALEGA